MTHAYHTAAATEVKHRKKLAQCLAPENVGISLLAFIPNIS
jgi:hypothetical protein